MESMLISTESMIYHCPFNPAHCMPKKTVQKHVVRCPDRPLNYVNCMYNILHVMHKAEQEKHESECPDRTMIDPFIFQSADIQRPVPVLTNVPVLEYEESWENLEESNVLKTINSTTTSMKAIHGLTKSERKQHRAHLHQHEQLNNKSVQPDSMTSSMNMMKVEPINQKKPNENKKMFIGQVPDYK
ncbi:gametocyte-specific factor 1-like isoform X2 [Adelges cooleyi]|uniref:gametocyte-specific factor 1-like isoform X2 n=1 Tax=Adelges cooleyi TaxID=133065 RepID=UPI00217FC79B|nr:gametocyte-specific factor 1-like isoform X2 [Adelges cooleyi]